MPGEDRMRSSSTSAPSISRTRLLFIFLFALVCSVPLSPIFELPFFLHQPRNEPPRRQPPSSQLSLRPRWSFSEAPSYCHELVANPIKQIVCHRNQETQRCPNGAVSMMSQFFQDYYLYTRHFSRLRRRGIYLDIAANEPKHLSNTYFMDACLGWDGMCVEGNPSYLPKLRKQRNCRIIPRCVSDRAGQNVSFVLGGGSGGIVDTNKNMQAWKEQGRTHARINLQCTTMALVLREAHVTKVDYLSLDVEGHELMVLKGFDWDNIIVNVMTIEISDTTLQPIEKFLTQRGYVRHFPDLDERTIRTGILYHDAVFLHHTVTFGEPK